MIRDLFGNILGQKSIEDEYKEYINSKEWRKLRALKLEQAGERCERCGLSKWSTKLEVHHIDYKHFKRERLEDLQVLCPECHASADEERVEKREEKRKDRAIIVGFENWMDNGDNPGWRRWNDNTLRASWKVFVYQLAERQRKPKYKDIPFWRSPNWK